MKQIIIISIIAGLITIFLFLNQNNSFKNSFPKISTQADKDRDNINDIEDILAGARQEVKNKTVYKDGYFSEGFPPDGQGVCTDVIWRAFKNAGYDIKKMIDEDIQKNTSDYPRVAGKPEPNIDFRRVPNLESYLQKYAHNLPIEIIPNNFQNLNSWQAGDIIIFGKPKDHIAIISDKRNQNGVPYIIHNGGPVAKENDMLLYWHENISPIIGHYRIKY